MDVKKKLHNYIKVNTLTATCMRNLVYRFIYHLQGQRGLINPDENGIPYTSYSGIGLAHKADFKTLQLIK